MKVKTRMTKLCQSRLNIIGCRVESLGHKEQVEVTIVGFNRGKEKEREKLMLTKPVVRRDFWREVKNVHTQEDSINSLFRLKIWMKVTSPIGRIHQSRAKCENSSFLGFLHWFPTPS